MAHTLFRSTPNIILPHLPPPPPKKKTNETILLRQKLRECFQPLARSSLGLLEKHKDYKIRAQVHHRKQETLKILQRKARQKNKNEFYFGKLKSQLIDGIHTKKSPHSSNSQRDLQSLDSNQQKLAQTQDLAYIRSKLVHDQRRFERLQMAVSSGRVIFQGKKHLWNDEDAEFEARKDKDILFTFSIV